MKKKLGEPYCGACGYALVGATGVAVCPECGAALVDVLERKAVGNTANYRRYRSARTVFGWPLVDVAFGADPGERMGHARGVIAVGEDAVGLVAIGLFTRGGLCIGTIGCGVFSFSAAGFGLIAAFGGTAVAGGAAFGGMAVSGFYAFGGLAAGHAGIGGVWYQLW